MSNNLKYLAEQVSKDFLINKVSMNDSISKLAEQKNLNKHQIDRVVEQANQLTYLSLFNSGNDKYASVNFEVADASVIRNNVKGTKKVARVFLDDYVVNTLEKEAACKKHKKKKKSDWQTRNELQKKAEYLRTRGGENRVRFERTLEKFAHDIKVAFLLNKVSYSDLNAVFPPEFIEKVSRYYKIPGHTKEASSLEDGILNENHQLVKTYDGLSKIEDEYIELHKEARELYKEAVTAVEEATSPGPKHLMSGIASEIAKAWNVIKEIPAKHLVGYPAAFLLGVMYQKSKEENKTLTGNDVPLIFRAY